MGKYRDAADTLQAGREARLAGSMQAAVRLETRGEALIPVGQRDELMSAWECSLANSPIELEEWRATGAYSQIELLEGGYIDHLPTDVLRAKDQITAIQKGRRVPM